MTRDDKTLEVTLYLRGQTLDPEHITSILKVKPSNAHRNGEEKISSTDHKYLTKVGLWALRAEKDSRDIAVLIEELASNVCTVGKSLAHLTGVDDAYVDVFIAVDADDEGGGTLEIEVSQETIRCMSALDLPLRITAVVVKE